MRRTVLISWSLLLASLPVGAGATETWRPIADVVEVTVRVHWVSVGELKAAARALGKRADSRPMGFSVLRRNASTGRFECDVYLVDRPARLQDRATASLGHGIAHCLGFSHE